MLAAITESANPCITTKWIINLDFYHFHMLAAIAHLLPLLCLHIPALSHSVSFPLIC